MEVSAGQQTALSLRIFRAGYSRRSPGQMSLGWDWPHVQPSERRTRTARTDTRRAAPPQPSLRFRLRRAPTITPLMLEVERVLKRLSESNAEMPNNPVLGERCGGRRRNSVDRALLRLQTLGRIRIERERGRRRVLVAETGHYTGWGEARPGHAPFCRSGRPGMAAATPPPVLPVRVSDVSLPRLPSLAGWSFPRAAAAIARAVTCQWPLWPDGGRPDGRYCGEPVNRASRHSHCSFCAAHERAVYA